MDQFIIKIGPEIVLLNNFSHPWSTYICIYGQNYAALWVGTSTMIVYLTGCNIGTKMMGGWVGWLTVWLFARFSDSGVETLTLIIVIMSYLTELIVEVSLLPFVTNVCLTAFDWAGRYKILIANQSSVHRKLTLDELIDPSSTYHEWWYTTSLLT